MWWDLSQDNVKNFKIVSEKLKGAFNVIAKHMRQSSQKLVDFKALLSSTRVLSMRFNFISRTFSESSAVGIDGFAWKRETVAHINLIMWNKRRDSGFEVDSEFVIACLNANTWLGQCGAIVHSTLLMESAMRDFQSADWKNMRCNYNNFFAPQFSSLNLKAPLYHFQLIYFSAIPQFSARRQAQLRMGASFDKFLFAECLLRKTERVCVSLGSWQRQLTIYVPRFGWVNVLWNCAEESK